MLATGRSLIFPLYWHCGSARTPSPTEAIKPFIGKSVQDSLFLWLVCVVQSAIMCGIKVNI